MKRHHSSLLGLAAPVLAMVAVLACGGDSSSLTEPPPTENDPSEPSNPAPDPAPEPQGQVVYATDDENNMLVFGTENVETAHVLKITGIPFLEHVVGIGFRPSNGLLYGVASDGRLYTIDAETGAATAVSSEPFTTEIGSFDHFGMSFDPETERIRLIRQGGANWSIDPDDGTAIRQADIHYAAGDPNEGKTPGGVGFAYVPPGAVDIPELDDASWISPAGGSPVKALLYDYLNGNLAGTIDPETGEFQSLGPVDWIQSTTCATITFDPSGVLWALAPLAAVISPELAGAYALVRMSPTGIISSVVGAVGSQTAQTAVFGAIQAMTFFDVATGQGPGQGTG